VAPEDTERGNQVRVPENAKRQYWYGDYPGHQRL